METRRDSVAPSKRFLIGTALCPTGNTPSLKHPLPSFGFCGFSWANLYPTMKRHSPILRRRDVHVFNAHLLRFSAIDTNSVHFYPC